jgi:DNA-directed RNA polymerase specialized sigma24 family protein
MISKPDEILDTVDRKLAILIKLAAYQLAQGKSLAEAAPVLRRLGLNASDIAAVFDSTTNTVNVMVSKGKKKKKSK